MDRVNVPVNLCNVKKIDIVWQSNFSHFKRMNIKDKLAHDVELLDKHIKEDIKLKLSMYAVMWQQNINTLPNRLLLPIHDQKEHLKLLHKKSQI
jgi:hypothetical protein